MTIALLQPAALQKAPQRNYSYHLLGLLGSRIIRVLNFITAVEFFKVSVMRDYYGYCIMRVVKITKIVGIISDLLKLLVIIEG